MPTLAEFIDEKIAIAQNYRGLSRLNPVEILVEYGGKQFVVLVSLLEPDTLTVPYNVTWINADPNHEDYKVLMRRVDAEKYDDKNYRGSWSVLSSVEEIFTEEQYFKKEADPIVGEIQDFRPALASVDRFGGFFLAEGTTTSETEPVAVGDNDLRMSDAREPAPHSHPDVPRTMISAGDGTDKYVSIPSTDAPNGTMLFITEVLPDGNFVAEWLPATTEFAYSGPRPASIAVVGPVEKVKGNSNHILRADVVMDDGQNLYSVQATWTLRDNQERATINPNTGVFHANAVAVDTPVTVRASWKHEESGQVVFVDYVITIEGDPTLVLLDHIEIVGPSTFPKNQTGTYTVRAHWSDASTSIVTPNIFSSSNSGAGSFTGGVLTPFPNQIRDKQTTISASYTSNGITRTASLPVTISDPNVYPDSIVINGANSVDQNASTTLLAHVVFSDGTNSDVTASWTVTASTYATIDAATGVLTAKPLTAPGSKSVEVNVSYTLNGVTVTAKKTIAIIDTKIWPVSATVTGLASLTVGNTAQYTYTVTYGDGSTQVKNPTSWASSNTAAATVNSSGLATGVADGNTNIVATYSEDGITLNAAKSITVATGASVLPFLRYGTAMFSNREFTGGPIASEITQEELDYGVSLTNAPGANLDSTGRPYTRWTGLNDFVSKVMVNTLDLKPGDAAKTITTTIEVDDYIYLMWPASAGGTFIIDLANGFQVTFDGIMYRTDLLGNNEGLPGYDANLPKTMTVQYDDGNGMQDWIIVRSAATTAAQFSPRTDNHSIRYV